MEQQQPYFDDAYRQMAVDGCAQCAVTRDFLQKCKACGLKVDDEEARNAQHEDFLTKFRQQFFPNMP